MKKLVIYLLISSFFIAACRKEDNPKIPVLERVPLPQLKVDKTGTLVISSETPDAFNGKFSVSMFYPEDVKPSKVDIVVIKNGDKSNVKTVQAGITTLPATVSFTGAMIKTLFGTSSVLGDAYTLAANVTTESGKLYPAFSTLGETNNGGLSSIIGSTPQITYSAVCPFKMTDYGAIGTVVPYTVVTDEWADYGVGQTIPVTIIDATHLSFFYGADFNPKPIVITVDPTDNSTSVASVTYGGYGGPPLYSAVSVEGSADNTVLPCQLTVGVKLSHSSSAGGAISTIKLKKK
jgi:hypothetical protein